MGTAARASSCPRHGMMAEDKEWEAPFFAPPRVAPDVPAVLAFAAALQAHLGTIVTACLFAPAGGGQDAEFPCALVTVEPFSPGGLRRLALNARSELVNQAAAAYVKGVTHASRDRPSAAAFGRRQTAAALEIGAAMLHSASWPIDNNFDLVPVIAWENPNPNPKPNPNLNPNPNPNPNPGHRLGDRSRPDQRH